MFTEVLVHQLENEKPNSGVVHIMDNYRTMKKIRIFATVWINLTGISSKRARYKRVYTI